MANPLAKTWETLAASADPAAADLLAAALESPSEKISLPAALAFLDRPGVQGQREILLRFSRLIPSAQQALRARAEQFEPWLRQALISGSDEQRLAGLDAARWLLAVDQIPNLIQLLCTKDGVSAEAVGRCLLDLITLVDEEVRTTSVTDTHRNAILARRDRAIGHLDQAITNRYESLVVKEPLIESILILTPPQQGTVKKVLWQAAADCRERAGRMLLASRHPKIMRQALESLRQSYPHPKAFEAVATRIDLEFLCELLQAVSTRNSPAFDKNLRQIEHLEWLQAGDPPFALIPQELQPALLSLVFATKVPAEFKSLAQDWMLRNGGPAGRMAAADRVALVDEDVIQGVLVDSLDADDEHVQAWAVTQLREHAVPETFALLLERLESPSAEVRDAVRKELSDFNLERVMGLIEDLDRASASRVGELVRKIDERACEKLRHDIEHAIRPKRIRAAKAAVKLGFERWLLPSLLPLADDSDVLIRRMIAEELGTLSSHDVLPVLDRLTQDPHPRVRDAAVRALTNWHKHSAEHLDPLLAT